MIWLCFPFRLELLIPRGSEGLVISAGTLHRSGDSVWAFSPFAHSASWLTVHLRLVLNELPFKGRNRSSHRPRPHTSSVTPTSVPGLVPALDPAQPSPSLQPCASTGCYPGPDPGPGPRPIISTCTSHCLPTLPHSCLRLAP